MVDRYDVLRRFGRLRTIPDAGLGSMEAALDNQVNEEAGGVSLADLFAEQRSESMNPVVYRLREGVESMIDPSVGENLDEFRERRGGISRAGSPYTVSEVVQRMEDPLFTRHEPGQFFSAMTREDIEKLAATEEAEGTAGEGATMTDMLEHVRRQPLDRADSFDEFIGRSKPPSEISLNEFIGLSRKKEGEGGDGGEGEGEGEGEGGGEDTGADRSAAQELIDKLAGGKRDSKQLITDYKQEYMDLMPEYEGKTEYEKGMDLMKFGMAIAAGDDPNALKNITKGFLAMGDTFTKDAAEKREWERKVAISASSHVLNRRKEDRDTALQIGLKNAELLSDFDVAKLKQDAKDNKTAFDRALEFAKGTQITAKEATDQASVYGGYVDDYDTAIEGKELVAYMARAALGTKDEAGEVIGLGNWAKNQVNKAVNALTGGKHNTLEKFRSSAPEEYAKAQKRLAVKLADILLKESGKTISDRDRDLVQELVGGMVNEKGFVTADPEVLIESFRYIENQMDNRMASSLRKMEALESGYIDKSVIGTGIYDPGQGAFVGGRMVVGDVFPGRAAGMIRDKEGVQRELFQDVPIDYRKELMKDGRILSIDEVMKARRQS